MIKRFKKINRALTPKASMALFTDLEIDSRKNKKNWLDMGYLGQKTRDLARTFNIEIEVVKRLRKWFWLPKEAYEAPGYLKAERLEPGKKFHILPWLVERTFAWLGRYRKTAKDYEYLTTTSETILFAIMSKLMLKRIDKCLS